MVGFNEDLEKIKIGLTGWESELQYVPIIGMGVIGKTTLARNVFEDKKIMEHFQVRIWVTVSQDYSLRRITLNLLDSMKEYDPDWKEGAEERSELAKDRDMELKVYKILCPRRFLIVLDNVWSKKALNDVKYLFPNENNGSRIMLTTRLREVATFSKCSILPLEIHLMDEDQSWNLLRKKVFIDQDHVPHELESIGREIARSCRGLPLAIVEIAGVLSMLSKTPTSWEEVAQNVRSYLAAADVKIQKTLSSSYNDLPNHLRPCFLYMGGLHHDIKVTKVIRLWIAESLVKPVEFEELEDTAEAYFYDLADRSLILITKRRPNGKIKYFRLHDTVREMCMRLSQEEKSLVHIKDRQELESMKDERRISISHSDQNTLSSFYLSIVSSVMYFNNMLSSFKYFRLLKVLDLLRAGSMSCSLSHQISQLFHLRYLAFCNSYTIPRKLSDLQCLQTLIIKEMSASCLPYEIWSMKQLRHLITYDNCFADTGAVTALQNLQTLGIKNLPCSVNNLNLIPNLKKLWITYSSGYGEFLFQNLVCLIRLEKLHLQLGDGWHSSCKPNLVVPSSLKELTLIGWGHRDLDLNLVGPFPNLEVLKLKCFDFVLQKWTTTDEDFPQLEFLLIEESNLIDWETGRSHFPRLKDLLIHSCLGLREIPNCVGEFPSLDSIELKLCTKSLADSAKQIQEEAQENGDYDLRVLCIDCEVIQELLVPGSPSG